MVIKGKVIAFATVGAFVLGTAMGSVGAITWYTDRVIAEAKQANAVLLQRQEQATVDALESMRRVHEEEKRILIESAAAKADLDIVRPVVGCNLPRGTVGMLNVSRTGERGSDTIGLFASGDARPSSVTQKDNVEASADCGRKYRVCSLHYEELYKRVATHNERVSNLTTGVR